MHIPWFYYVGALVLSGVIWRKIRKPAPSILTFYLFIMYTSTVLNRTSVDTPVYDFTPFRFLQQSKWHLFESFQANVIMFMPIGFLLFWTLYPNRTPQTGSKFNEEQKSSVNRRNRVHSFIIALVTFILTAMISCILSCVIEYSQYKLCRGMCETDDVIANTIGAVIGAVLYNATCFILRRCKEE